MDTIDMSRSNLKGHMEIVVDLWSEYLKEMAKHGEQNK
jgi:hypothetical protein